MSCPHPGCDKPENIDWKSWMDGRMYGVRRVRQFCDSGHDRWIDYPNPEEPQGPGRFAYMRFKQQKPPRERAPFRSVDCARCGVSFTPVTGNQKVHTACQAAFNAARDAARKTQKRLCERIRKARNRAKHAVPA